MNKAVALLFSGLHFVDEELESREDFSCLQTDVSFSQKIENYINGINGRNNKLYKTYIKYLFILGDLSSRGEKEEFNKVKNWINSITSEYKIEKKNVFILPGNHDVERENQRRKFRELKCTGSNCELSDLQKEKLSSFQEFYTSFYKNVKDDSGKNITYDPDRAISRVLYVKEFDTVFLGINTLFKESYKDQDHIGYINISALRTELKAIREEYPEKKIIILFHHKPLNMGSSENDVIENWNECLTVFIGHSITSFVSGGNVRTSGCRVIQNEICEFIQIGSISPIKPNNKRFSMIYNDKQDQNKILRIEYYQYIENGESNRKSQYWQKMEDPESLEEIIVNSIEGPESVGLGVNNIENGPMDEYKRDEQRVESQQYTDERNAQDFVIDVIKKHNLYKLGFFHWSPEGETISYILMDYFFENYDSIERIKAYYDGVIKYRKIKPDLIIGYEMNGNMVGSLLAIKHECDYTYLPADDKIHTAIEHELPNNNYKTIVVILDLVFTKHLITKITEKVLKSYLGVNKIYYVALIEGTKAITIQKYDEKNNKKGGPVSEEKKFTNGEKLEVEGVSNVEIYAYSICQIPIITTPFTKSNPDFFTKQIIPEYHLYTPEI